MTTKTKETAMIKLLTKEFKKTLDNLNIKNEDIKALGRMYEDMYRINFKAYPQDTEKQIKITIRLKDNQVVITYVIECDYYGSQPYQHETIYELFDNWIENVKSFITNQVQDL